MPEPLNNSSTDPDVVKNIRDKLNEFNASNLTSKNAGNPDNTLLVDEKEKVGEKASKGKEEEVSPGTAIPLELKVLRHNASLIDRRIFTPQINLFRVTEKQKDASGEIKEVLHFIEISELPIGKYEAFCEVIEEYPGNLDIALRKGLDKEYQYIIPMLKGSLKELIVQEILKLNSITKILEGRQSIPRTEEQKKEDLLKLEKEPPLKNESLLSVARLIQAYEHKVPGPTILKEMTLRQLLWNTDLLLLDNYKEEKEEKEETEEDNKGKSVGGKITSTSNIGFSGTNIPQKNRIKKTHLTGSRIERKFFSELPGDAVLKEDTGGCLVYSRTYKTPNK